MLNMYKCLIVLVGLTLLQGCGVFFGKEGLFRAKQNDYMGAGSIKPVVVPEGMEARPMVEMYEIPNSSATDEFGDEIILDNHRIPRPRMMKNAQSETGVKIKRLGDDEWVFLDAPAAQIWPRTQNFLSQEGMAVVRNDVPNGIIETGVVYTESGKTQTRYRVQVEKSIHSNTTEVRILSVSAPISAPFPTDVNWPTVAVEKDKPLLRRLAETLAIDLGNKSASLLGQNIGGEAKSSLGTVNGEPRLFLNLPKVRAEASLKRAIEKTEVTLWGVNSQQSIFYVGYMNQDQTSPFYMHWLGLADKLDKTPRIDLTKALKRLDDKPVVHELFDSVNGVEFSKWPAKGQRHGYFVVLVPNEQGYQVAIRDAHGRPLDAYYIKPWLQTLRNNLL